MRKCGGHKQMVYQLVNGTTAAQKVEGYLLPRYFPSTIARFQHCDCLLQEWAAGTVLKLCALEENKKAIRDVGIRCCQ